MKLLRIFIFLPFILPYSVLFAQHKTKVPDIKKVGGVINDFIPTGWAIVQKIETDFNNDSLLDVVMVLSSDDPESGGLLLILLNKKSEYVLSGFSSSTILCQNCGGMKGSPFQGISVKGNVLTVEHVGGSSWMWEYEDKFRFKNGNWYLLERTYNFYHGTEYCDSLRDYVGEYKHENLITGNSISKKIDEQCHKTETKIKVKPNPLIKLSDFKLSP